MSVRRATGGAALAAATLVLITGCGSDGDGEDGGGTARPPSPSRAQVVWADTMCENVALVERTKADSAEDIESVRVPEDESFLGPEHEARSYLSGLPSSLEEAAAALKSLRPVGVRPADAYRKELAGELGRVTPQVDKLSDFFTISSLSGKALVARAEKAAKLVASLELPEPGLKAVTAEDPELRRARELAPGCVPPAGPSASPGAQEPVESKKLPEADDGEDVGACEDGDCEVLVTDTADIEVDGRTYHVGVDSPEVTLNHSTPGGGKGRITMIGPNGRGTFGKAGGKAVTFRTKGVNKDGAVIDISTS
jgi:hypothetical protein